MIFAMREGIEIRIEKVQSEKEVYQMGLLVWKSYMERQGHVDDEEEAFEINAEEVFKDFVKKETKV